MKALVIELISPLQTSLFLVLMAAMAQLIIKNKKLASKLVCASLIWLLTWSQPYAADVLLYPLERSQKVKRLQYKNQRTPDYIFVLACYYNTEGDSRRFRVRGHAPIPFNVLRPSTTSSVMWKESIPASALNFYDLLPSFVTGGVSASSMCSEYQLEM